MLKAIESLPTYENVKCGEIFCVSSTPMAFHVTCCICEEKISFEKFVLHFKSLHSILTEESYSLQDPLVTKPTTTISIEPVNIKLEQELSEVETDLDDSTSLLEILGESKNTQKRNKKSTQEEITDIEEEESINEEDNSLNYNNLHEIIEDWMANDDSSRDSEVDNNVQNDNVDDRNNIKVLDARNKTLAELQCEICHRQYTTLKTYNRHMCYSHNIKLYYRKVNYKYNCKECAKVFRTPRDLNSHTKKIHGYSESNQEEEIKEHQCDICQRKYKSLKNFNAHMKLHSRKINYKSKFIESALENIEPEELEMEAIEETTYEEKQTHEQANDNSSARESEDDIDDDNNDDDDDCNNIKVLDARNKTLEDLQCEICHRQYTTVKTYNRHMCYSHNIKLYYRKVSYKYKCDECPRAFRSPRDLNSHTRKIHGNSALTKTESKQEEEFEVVSPYQVHQCDICQRKYKSFENFKAHMKLHSRKANNKYNSLSTSRDIKTGKLQHLQQEKHIERALENIESDEEMPNNESSSDDDGKPEAKKAKLQQNDLTCRICGRQYASVKLRNKHMSVTHQIKVLSRKVNYKYKCDECEKLFRIERDINLHILKHHRESKNKDIITVLTDSQYTEPI
ncbi:uncharacterized protein isoform X2 [Musca autumnalis]|uniref:uncharacterized protein isoform X2 n=1 Tax=Musca autumnalis TaxID=221902 RepID=UPI003CF79009